MGRPPGSRNKAKAPSAKAPSADGEVSISHNEPLTDEQLQALFEQHKKHYEAALADKKKADADFKNVCKRAKGEGVSIADIRLAIDLEGEGGVEKLREKIAAQHRVARWFGLPVGTQPSFFDHDDRTPSIDKAFNDGKRAGLKGDAASPPHHLGVQQSSSWLDGHAAGQAVIAARFKEKHDEQRAEDSKAFDKQG